MDEGRGGVGVGMELLKDLVAGYCELLWSSVESVMQAGPEGVVPGVPVVAL